LHRVYRYHNILICLFLVLIIRIMHQSHNGQWKDQSNNLSDNNRIKMYGLKNMCHLQSNNYVICPFHLENLMSVKSPLGLVLYCYLNMPTINKTCLILSYLILSYVIGQKVDTWFQNQTHISQWSTQLFIHQFMCLSWFTQIQYFTKWYFITWSC